jgi:hypothetical protein
LGEKAMKEQITGWASVLISVAIVGLFLKAYLFA